GSFPSRGCTSSSGSTARSPSAPSRSHSATPACARTSSPSASGESRSQGDQPMDDAVSYGMPATRSSPQRPDRPDASPNNVSAARAFSAHLAAAVTFATTEHFNLQTARATTVAEANGRASIYLAALSSSL